MDLSPFSLVIIGLAFWLHFWLQDRETARLQQQRQRWADRMADREERLRTSLPNPYTVMQECGIPWPRPADGGHVMAPDTSRPAQEG